VTSERGILTRNMVVLYVSGFIYGIAGYMWTPFWALYIISLGATLTEVGLVLSLRRALGMIMDLTGGAVSDISGRKRLIILSGYIAPLGLVVYFLAKSWEQLLLGTVLISIDSIRENPLQAIQAESVDPRHRARAFAGFETATSIPGIIIPAVAGVIMEAQGVLVGEKTAIAITIGCVLLANTVRAIFLEETLTTAEKSGMEKRRISENFRKTAAGVFHNGPIRTIMVSRAIAHFALDALSPLLVVYCIENVGITDTEYGIVTGISLVAMIASRLPVARLSDTLGTRNSILIAGFLYPLIPVAYFMAPNFYWLIIAATIEPIANSFNFPARNAYIADLVPANRRAGTFSVMFAVITLIAIPGSVVGAMLWDAYGPPATFALCVGLFIASELVLVAYLKEDETR